MSENQLVKEGRQLKGFAYVNEVGRVSRLQSLHNCGLGDLFEQNKIIHAVFKGMLQGSRSSSHGLDVVNKIQSQAAKKSARVRSLVSWGLRRYKAFRFSRTESFFVHFPGHNGNRYNC